MAQNKKNNFNQQYQDMARFAKALSHPARIAIMQTLAEKQSCICGEIVEVLPLAQSTVSQHLKELQSLGLIKGEIQGPKSCYCLNIERFSELSQLLTTFCKELHTKSPTCICDNEKP